MCKAAKIENGVEIIAVLWYTFGSIKKEDELL